MHTVTQDSSGRSGIEDGISTAILKDVFFMAGDRLVNVINQSLCNGTFPPCWKISVIVPAPKVSNTNKRDEFWPINTVSPIMWVPNQFGFRKTNF